MRALIVVWVAMVVSAGCSKKREERARPRKETRPTARKSETRPVEQRPRPRARGRESGAEVEAVVAEVSGSVTIQSPGQDARPVTKETTLRSGDVLRTDTDGRVTVVLWDQSSLELAPNSALLVEGSDSVTDPTPGLTVMAGLAHVEAAKRQPGMGPLLVHTPNAVVTVTGTSLDVGVAVDATTRVGVEEGKVQVSGDATLQARPLELPQGKAVEVAPDGKPGKLEAYVPQKADWVGWLDRRNERAAAKADQLLDEHLRAMEELRKRAEELEKASEPLLSETEAMAEKAEKALAAKKAEELAAIQPEVATRLESVEVAYETQRLLEAQLQARAFLVALLAAQAQAGLVKIPKAKVAKVVEQAKRFPVLRLRWLNRFQRWRPRWHRLRRVYYRFHPRGWRVASVVGADVRPAVAVVKFKPRPLPRVTVRIPGYTRPLYRPPFVRLRIRPGLKVRLRPRGWYRGGRWKLALKRPRFVRWPKMARRLRKGRRLHRLRIPWRLPAKLKGPAVRVQVRGAAKVRPVRLKGPGHVGRVGRPGVRIKPAKLRPPVRIKFQGPMRRRGHGGMGHGRGH